MVCWVDEYDLIALNIHAMNVSEEQVVVKVRAVWIIRDFSFCFRRLFQSSEWFTVEIILGQQHG